MSKEINNSTIRPEDALNYHMGDKPGKIEVVPTKPVSSQRDLALAYSPGVAEPCKAIAANPEDVYKYTAKGNLIGVISNGTAVLGLGNIGPDASKPVMEGKGVLFKKFAGLDVFDIEINCEDPEQFVKIVESLEPTFGGINLEDIKAPECFYIEQELRKRMNIPVMHDDQHGTAIISSAALLNAVELTGKKIGELKLVVSGAGAAAVACTTLYAKLGVNPENIVMIDIDGVIRKDRPNLHPTHVPFATSRNLNTLSEAIVGADMFLGLSVGGVLKPEMVKAMAANPIVFALANPNPEIDYETAMATRDDLIMATGRSDTPNQVNNVLGFPYIFRGALDVRATEINDEMKLAAVRAIAELAKEPVDEFVNQAYGDNKISFGRFYLIPKPLDPRLITAISPAVAKAAIESGIAKYPITDWDKYKSQLLEKLGRDNKLISRIIAMAKQSTRKRVVFAEAHHYKILKAAQIVVDEGIAEPVLLGSKKRILAIAKEYDLDIDGCMIIDQLEDTQRQEDFAQLLYQKRQRKGMTLEEARRLIKQRNYFGAGLVETGQADAMISGLTKDYPRTILPALHMIGIDPGVNRVAGMYVLISPKGTFFFADTTVNVDPTVEQLTDIVALTADAVKKLGETPRIALLSYSNFGSSKGAVPDKMQKALIAIRKKYPELIIEGELQGDIALDPEIQQENFPFSKLKETGANTLIFPALASGNISYKLVQSIGGAESIGPILMGMNKPVHVLQMGCSVREIVNMVAIAVIDAQINKENIKQ